MKAVRILTANGNFIYFSQLLTEKSSKKFYLHVSVISIHNFMLYILPRNYIIKMEGEKEREKCMFK